MNCPHAASFLPAQVMNLFPPREPPASGIGSANRRPIRESGDAVKPYFANSSHDFSPVTGKAKAAASDQAGVPALRKRS